MCSTRPSRNTSHPLLSALSETCDKCPPPLQYARRVYDPRQSTQTESRAESLCRRVHQNLVHETQFGVFRGVQDAQAEEKKGSSRGLNLRLHVFRRIIYIFLSEVILSKELRLSDELSPVARIATRFTSWNMPIRYASAPVWNASNASYELACQDPPTHTPRRWQFVWKEPSE